MPAGTGATLATFIAAVLESDHQHRWRYVSSREAMKKHLKTPSAAGLIYPSDALMRAVLSPQKGQSQGLVIIGGLSTTERR